VLTIFKISGSRLTYETRRVVVTGGLGVTVGLQHWIGRDDLILERALVLAGFGGGGGGSDEGKVLDDLLGVLSLTGTRLTTVYIIFIIYKLKI
jgi:hypothetical protein